MTTRIARYYIITYINDRKYYIHIWRSNPSKPPSPIPTPDKCGATMYTYKLRCIERVRKLNQLDDGNTYSVETEYYEAVGTTQTEQA